MKLLSPCRAEGTPYNSDVARSKDELREHLSSRVVSRLFEGLPSQPRKPTVPLKVWENRRRRAEDQVVDTLMLTGSAEVPEPLVARVNGIVERWFENDFDGGFDDIEALEIELATGDPESSHRQRLRDRWGYVELFGLQVQRRVWMELDTLYLPQRLRTERFVEETLGKATVRRPVEVKVSELLRELPRVLVVGGPGSGKSTLARHLATRAGDRLPFLVPVRALDGRLTPAAIARIHDVEESFVAGALEQDRALLLIDGLDESPDARPLLGDLGALLARHPTVPCVITSRPASVDSVPPPGFERAHLLELTRDEIDTFVDRWCRAAETSVASDASTATAEHRAAKAAADLKARLRRSRPVAELARTPLLAAVLCVVHRFLGRRIPERRAALYEAATNVLLYEWDAAKFGPGARIGTLDAPQKRVLLGALALAMHEARDSEWAEGEVVAVLEDHLDDVGGASEDAPRLLQEIRDRSGVLVEASPGRFAFSHRSFQEYLAAVEIVRLGDVERLLHHRDDPDWHETIQLAAGLPNSPVAAIVEGLLADGALEGVILAARALEGAIAAPRSLRERVEQGLVGLIPPDGRKALEAIERAGGIAGPLLVEGLRSNDPAVRIRSACGIVAANYEPGYPGVLELLEDGGEFSGRVVLAVEPGWVWFGDLENHELALELAIALADLNYGPANDALQLRIRDRNVRFALRFHPNSPTAQRLLATAEARRETPPPTPDEPQR